VKTANSIPNTAALNTRAVTNVEVDADLAVSMDLQGISGRRAEEGGRTLLGVSVTNIGRWFLFIQCFIDVLDPESSSDPDKIDRKTPLFSQTRIQNPRLFEPFSSLSALFCTISLLALQSICQNDWFCP